MAATRYTKKDVKREINKLKRRLKTFSSHTPTLSYDINEDYIYKIGRKEAVELLQSIKWNNTGKMSKKSYKTLTITATGKNRFGKTETVIPNEKKQQLLTALRKREKITGKPFNVNIQSPKSIDAAIEFTDKWETKEEYKQWLDERNTQALENFKNNIKLSLGYAEDTISKAIGEIIIDLVNSGRLDINRIKSSNLNDIAGLNLFDSIDDATLKANAQAILDELRIAIPITDEEIAQKLRDKGIDEETIKEYLG